MLKDFPSCNTIDFADVWFPQIYYGSIAASNLISDNKIRQDNLLWLTDMNWEPRLRTGLSNRTSVGMMLIW